MASASASGRLLALSSVSGAFGVTSSNIWSAGRGAVSLLMSQYVLTFSRSVRPSNVSVTRVPSYITIWPFSRRILRARMSSATSGHIFVSQFSRPQ